MLILLKMENKIVITSWKYNKDDDVHKLLNDDVDLLIAIADVKSELEVNNIEVFNQQDNIIFTERGCYGAFFEKDLQTV